MGISEGRARLQEDLDRLEEWANKNLMKLNKDKCKVLHLGQYNPGMQYGIDPGGRDQLCRKVVVDNKLSMSEHCLSAEKQANKMLGCVNKSRDALS